MLVKEPSDNKNYYCCLEISNKYFQIQNLFFIALFVFMCVRVCMCEWVRVFVFMINISDNKKFNYLGEKYLKH